MQYDGIRNGDLLFQVAGDTEFARAISTSTATGSLDFAHVGILAICDRDTLVIEANTDGVVTTPLHVFLDNSPRVAGRPGVVVMRVSDKINTDDAVSRAKTYLGAPYDWEFAPKNGKLYCSELVQACYLDNEGHQVFGSVPMNFLDGNGHLPPFWATLFANMGKPVPHGQPGTNPNSIYRSGILTKAKSFF